MRLLQLRTRGAERYTLVDDGDYKWLSQWVWSFHRGGGPVGGYAKRTDPETGGIIFMHRAIMGSPAGMVVDHINGLGLDNRRANLRVVTRRENQNNLPVHRGRVSTYRISVEVLVKAYDGRRERYRKRREGATGG